MVDHCSITSNCIYLMNKKNSHLCYAEKGKKKQARHVITLISWPLRRFIVKFWAGICRKRKCNHITSNTCGWEIFKSHCRVNEARRRKRRHHLSLVYMIRTLVLISLGVICYIRYIFLWYQHSRQLHFNQSEGFSRYKTPITFTIEPHTKKGW